MVNRRQRALDRPVKKLETMRLNNNIPLMESSKEEEYNFIESEPIDELVDIAVKLGFDDVYDSEYFLQKSVEKLSDKIKHLQTTYAWIWYHANDETRSNIKGQIIDAYK